MTRLVREFNGEFGAFFQKEAQKYPKMFDEEAYVEDGVVRWRTNDHIPPDDILELWHTIGKPFDYEKSLKVSKKETMQSLKQYREHRAKHEYSDEEKAEMRAAFGKKQVMDVLTGMYIDTEVKK